MMIKPIKLLALVLLILLILPGVLSLGIEYIPTKPQPSLDGSLEINNQTFITETLICETDNLVAIGLSFKNPNLRNKKDISLEIFNSSGELLRLAKLNGSSIGDGAFVKFRFPVIEHCHGERISLRIAALNSAVMEGLEVLLSSQTDPATHLNINDKKEIANQKLALVNYYQPKSRVDYLLSIYQHWFEKFISNRAFVLSYIGVLILLIVASLWAKKTK